MSTKSCLIVDDSRVVRSVAREIFTEIGFTTSEAADGYEALEACRDTMPDVILLDWTMPRMSGMEFLRTLRAEIGDIAAKVIFCTARNDLDDIMAAMEEGASEYIMKPFDREIVEDKLTQVGLL